MKKEDMYNGISGIRQEFLDEADNYKTKKRFQWKRWVAVAACLCIVTTLANSFGLGVYAKSLLRSFGLYVGTSEIEIGEMIPIDFDIERFKGMPDVKPVQGSDVTDNDWYVLCKDSEELQAYSGIVLPSNEEIKFKDIAFHISGKNCNGHLSMDIIDGKGECVATMNGQFILAGNEDTESLGYGYELGRVKSTYKCDNGTEAYILKDAQSKDMQIVVFTANGIQYQLFVENTKESTVFAKRVVDLMCN